MRSRALSNVRWNAVSQFIKIGLYLLTSVILMRLLDPNDFGILGMATVFISLVAVFNDFGLGSAIIQKQEVDTYTLSSIFWLSVGISLLTMTFTILAAHSVAVFYNQPVLEQLLVVLSVSFLFVALGQVQLSLLIKEIKFKYIALIEIAASLISNVVAIIMAFNHFGVWSLVVQIILMSCITTILLWLLNHWRPSLFFSLVKIKGALKFGSGLLGFNILNYFSRNSDYLLIGKYLGPTSLGEYTFAYRLMQVPLQNISSVINRVLFPTLAQIQNDDERLQKGFIKVCQYIALITFPIMALVGILAPEIVLVIFGSKWQQSIPVIQVLAGIGALQSIITLVGNIYTAKGKTNLLFFWGIVSTFTAVLGIIIGLKYGIVGVAIGYACATVLLIYPNFAIPFRLIHLSFFSFIKALKNQIIITVSMGIVVAASVFFQRFLNLPKSFILVSNFILAVIILFLLIIYLDRITFLELIDAVSTKFNLWVKNLLRRLDSILPVKHA